MLEGYGVNTPDSHKARDYIAVKEFVNLFHIGTRDNFLLIRGQGTGDRKNHKDISRKYWGGAEQNCRQKKIPCTLGAGD